jgi:hypothetical protein
MLRAMIRLSMALSVLALLSGCAAHGVHFDGHSRPVLVAPAQVRELDTLPEDHERLGHASVRCTSVEGKRPADGSRLSDVDCSQSRLLAALSERASEVGGDLLVGRRCYSRLSEQDEVTITLAITCEADVARPSQDALGRRPLVAAVMAEDEAPRAAEAFDIFVYFTPAPGAPARAPRRTDSVREVPVLPVADVRLGDITTSCESGCTREGARLGLMAAAGRFGASDVVDVRCVAKGKGFLCTATAAAYEVDPELDARAR